MGLESGMTVGGGMGVGRVSSGGQTGAGVLQPAATELPLPEESELDRKIVAALQQFLRGRDWVDITTPRQINEACAAIVRISGVSLQKLNKKLKKGSWREKLTNFISRYPSIFALDMFENNFCVRLRHDDASPAAPSGPPHGGHGGGAGPSLLATQATVGGSGGSGAGLLRGTHTVTRKGGWGRGGRLL